MTWTRPWRAVAACALWLGLAMAPPAMADTATFSNNAPTAICPQNFGAPYPSTIDVTGMNGVISAATVTLGQYNTPASTVDVLLVSPSGKTVLVLSDLASEGPADITLDDAASQSVPNPAVGGTFKPTNAGANSDTFTGGAPAEPYGAAMSALSGDSPNGTWKLYVAENPATMAGCGSPDSIGTWSLNLTTTTPAAVPQSPAQDPVPVPPAVDPTAPQILSAEFAKPPVAGERAFLQVVARDPDSRISGLMVDFGEPLGLWAESSCIARQAAAGGTVQFDVPYRYLAAGPHTITLTILSGGCGESQATQQTKTVTVAGRPVSRRARASVTIPGPTVTSKCKNAAMAPTRAATKAILTALLCVMNEQRKQFKLKPLTLSRRLSKAAVAHTRSMILGGFFAHQGPAEPALVSRLRKVKFTGAAGENIGAGAGSLGSPVAMVDGWMHSPLHRANLLSKRWRAVGIGFLAQYPLKTAAQPVATYTTDFAPKP